MKTSRLLTKKQIAHSRYTRISNLLFIIPYHVTGSSPNASLWVYSKFFNTFPYHQWANNVLKEWNTHLSLRSTRYTGNSALKGVRVCNAR